MMSNLGHRAKFDREGNITTLNLSGFKLDRLPAEIGRLWHLRTLDLSRNLLTALPSEIGQLTNLEELDLSENRLTDLVPEVGKLAHLQHLLLWGNRLTAFPPILTQLTRLQTLDLSENGLPAVPPEIAELQNLEHLYLWGNRLKELPPEIGKLVNLQYLYLSSNRLTSLPPEIGDLAHLQDLDLSRNDLTALPREIMRLNELQSLALDHNPLVAPPLELAARGPSDVFDYLRDLARGCVTRYEAKLLLVGEGGTGKSSILRALRGETFEEGLATTHMIDIRPFSLPHPYLRGETITLNAWDFGGQQIYHTTHQFFMTKRSLYLLVWNARENTDQARLDHWLGQIQVLAPEAPVIIVATHIDERSADFNFQRFRDAFPQLVGHIGVSNKTGTGISELRNLIGREAAKLPVMQQQWPKTWVDAEASLRRNPNRYLSLAGYTAVCVQQGVEVEIAETAFGGYLHDLGRILYYQDDDALSDFVVLKPNWLTKAISRVLDDDSIRETGGVLAHSDFPRIWDKDESGNPYGRRLFPLFLRLMERYLISFRLDGRSPNQRATHSLVPLLLPYDPPPDMPPWSQVLLNQPEINMVFRLQSFVPPGLMSWFIALTHGYTQGLHWREGVRLQYKDHHAEVVLNPSRRELWLRVRGPAPSNFFSILQHTINDRILEYYFEGLEYRREVPCNCHLARGEGTPCAFFHDYERLVERMKHSKLTAECGESFQEVSVPHLLEGIHYTTDDRLAVRFQEAQRALSELVEGQDRIIEITSENRKLLIQNAQLFEQLNRSFMRLWNLQMCSLNAECPSTFILVPRGRIRFDPRNLFGTEYTLHLLCQNPSGPHVVSGQEGYRVPQAREWWIEIAPWLNRLIDFLRFIPEVRDVAETIDERFSQEIKTSLDIFEAIIKNLPEFKPDTEAERLGISRSRFEPFVAEGPALRALCNFLKRVDERRHWCGLHRTVTNDGNIFWLCDEHHEIYRP